MIAWQWADFLLGLGIGAVVVLLALLWSGVRAVQDERQGLVERRQRERP